MCDRDTAVSRLSGLHHSKMPRKRPPSGPVPGPSSRRVRARDGLSMQEIQRLLQMGENGGPELESALSDSDDDNKEETITTDTSVAEADATEATVDASDADGSDAAARQPAAFDLQEQ